MYECVTVCCYSQKSLVQKANVCNMCTHTHTLISNRHNKCEWDNLMVLTDLELNARTNSTIHLILWLSRLPNKRQKKRRNSVLIAKRKWSYRKWKMWQNWKHEKKTKNKWNLIINDCYIYWMKNGGTVLRTVTIINIIHASEIIFFTF